MLNTADKGTRGRKAPEGLGSSTLSLEQTC